MKFTLTNEHHVNLLDCYNTISKNVDIYLPQEIKQHYKSVKDLAGKIARSIMENYHGNVDAMENSPEACKLKLPLIGNNKTSDFYTQLREFTLNHGHPVITITTTQMTNAMAIEAMELNKGSKKISKLLFEAIEESKAVYEDMLRHLSKNQSFVIREPVRASLSWENIEHDLFILYVGIKNNFLTAVDTNEARAELSNYTKKDWNTSKGEIAHEFTVKIFTDFKQNIERNSNSSDILRAAPVGGEALQKMLKEHSEISFENLLHASMKFTNDDYARACFVSGKTPLDTWPTQNPEHIDLFHKALSKTVNSINEFACFLSKHKDFNPDKYLAEQRLRGSN